jgi:isochorismate pyruvate lyase
MERMERVERHAPEECSDMGQIRAEIDIIDREVIALLGQRFQYVLAASKFKTSPTAVRAPERFAAMLAQRRAWAEQEGLDPDAIERLYRDLVEHFIERELAHWRNQQPKP